MAKRKVFILLLFMVLSGGAILSFCGNNPLHQSQAAGVLTMKECLSCHNGMVGRAISVCLGNECMYTRNHSIMGSYPPHGKERAYASVKEIQDAGCILEDGKVTCLSCHDLTKPPPHIIRDGDRLCFICHIDKRSLSYQ
jgi:hypothetical protein